MKNQLKTLIGGLALLALSGCVAPQYNYRADYKEISDPPLNTETRVSIGDEMLRQAKYGEKDAIRVNSDHKMGLHYTIMSGVYLKKGEDEKREFYTPAGGADGGHIKKSLISDPPQAISRIKGSDLLSIITIVNVNVSGSKRVVDFEEIKLPVFSEDSFQQTLIYNGKVGDKINIGYREFNDNLARPAFSNEVEYDLSDSNMIAYKGASIEIIEATNEYIRYKVLKNFNTPSAGIGTIGSGM